MSEQEARVGADPAYEAALERLRLLCGEEEKEDRESGRCFGRHWAMQEASPRVLQRLHEADEYDDARAILEEAGALAWDRNAPAYSSDEFVEGFADAACEFWRAALMDL